MCKGLNESYACISKSQQVNAKHYTLPDVVLRQHYYYDYYYLPENAKKTEANKKIAQC